MAEESFIGQNEQTSQARIWTKRVISGGGAGDTLAPSDSAELPYIPKAIHNASSTGGTFEAVDANDVAQPFYINPGQELSIRPKKIRLTNFTVGLVLVLYKT